MGLRLAELLTRAIDAQTTDDKDRPAILLEAATTAAVDTPTVEALLDQSLTVLPDEATVRRIVEAAGAQPDEAIAEARGDGDTFDGDELAPEHDVLMANGGRLLEAVGPGEQPGTTRFKVVVIRPGQGKGPGTNYYTDRMLEAEAANFGAQPVFFNHEDLPTILKRGHGSRDPRDLAGWLNDDTTWDPSYTEPDDKKNGRDKGAVMGHVDFLLEAAELCEKLPKAVGLSVNMDPTKIKIGRNPKGKMARLVEGVVKGSGSVDLITGGAGAGGRVLERLRESAMSRYAAAHADLASVPDDRLVEAVRARPSVLAALRDPAQPPEVLVDEAEVTRLIEAAMADETATARIVEAVAGSPVFDRVVEAKVAEQRDAIVDEASAAPRRELDLRDMRDEAYRLIESRQVGRPQGILTPAFVEDLKSRYQLRAGGFPAPALDVYDELDDGGAVKTRAFDRLVESVTADIEREEAKLREANPARVGNLGGAQPDPPEGGPPNGDPPKREDPMAKRLGIDADTVHDMRESQVGAR